MAQGVKLADTTTTMDSGQQRLAELGYKQELKRDLSYVLSLSLSLSIRLTLRFALRN
jgi:hypothetical protein